MEHFEVEIYNYEKLLFKGEVEAFSTHNPEGQFDILGDHTNFISVINQKIEVVLSTKEKRSWDIESGVLRCLDRQVKAYVISS